MIVKAEIQSVDFASNTCVVRMPFFETSSASEPAITIATISNTPGIYNGYLPGDICLVAFDEGTLTKPVVVGKLFLGMKAEQDSPRGTANFEEMNVTKKATLPLDTKITEDLSDNIQHNDGGYAKFGSLLDLINVVRAHDEHLINDDAELKKKTTHYVQDFEPTSSLITDGDTWTYTGENKYEKVEQKPTTVEGYVGYYIKDGDEYIFIDSAEKAKAKIDEKNLPDAYKMTLQKNTTYVRYDGSWINADQTRINEILSTVAQLDVKSDHISARVSKKADADSKDPEEGRTATTGFGWILDHEKFVVYSEKDTSEKDTSEKNTIKKDVILATKDSVKIAGFTATDRSLTNEDVGFYVGESGMSVDNRIKNAEDTIVNSASNMPFAVFSDGSVYSNQMYMEGDDQSDIASIFDGNICGHNVKIDTVEFATTDTGQEVYKDKKDHAYRVERFFAKFAEAGINIWVRNCDRDGKLFEELKTETQSEYEKLKHHNCVLKDTTVAVAIKINYIKKKENQEDPDQHCSATCTLPITFPKIIYSEESSESEETSFSYDNENPQSVSLYIGVNVDSGKLIYATNPYFDNKEWKKECGPYQSIDALQGVTVDKLESFEPYGISPKMNKFFTGDLYNTTGFVKDKNGCFTEGMMIDLFSLDWQRCETYRTKSTLSSPSTIAQKWKSVTAIHDSNGTAYKLLHKGDTAIIKKDQLPGLGDFSYIASVQMTIIKRYFQLDPDAQEVLSADFLDTSRPLTLNGDSCADYYLNHPNPNELTYDISITDFGVALDRDEDDDTAPFGKETDSAFIRLRIESEPVVTQVDTVKVQKKGEEDTFESTISYTPKGIVVTEVYSEDGEDSSYHLGDIACFSIYGNNAKLLKSANSYYYESNVQASGAYLAETTLIQNQMPSNENITTGSITIGKPLVDISSKNIAVTIKPPIVSPPIIITSGNHAVKY